MSDKSYTEAAKDKFQDVKDRTAEMAGNVRDKVADTAEAAKEKISGAAGATREKAQDMKGSNFLVGSTDVGMDNEFNAIPETASDKMGRGKECAHDYKQQAGHKLDEFGRNIETH